MSITLDGSSGITAPTYGGVVASEYHVPVTAFKNRIINGAMQIDQRNAGASVTNAAGTVYTLDRFAVYGTVATKYTAQQNAGSVTPPAGFTNYLGITSSSAYSVPTSEAYIISQSIEGFNTADLQWGTVNAKTVTLSFQVYSSLTGTFGGALRNSASNRSYPFSYSIPVANTWTQISITIAGDTTGTWVGATNGIGINILWGLGVGATLSGTAGSWAGANYLSATGATSVVGTNGATFYITGVQLEKGSTATSFDYRPYGTELALCQRYAWNLTSSSGYKFMSASAYATSSTTANCVIVLPVPMRVSPTTTFSAANTFLLQLGGNNYIPTAMTYGSSTDTYTVVGPTISGATVGYGGVLLSNNVSANILFSSEL